MALDKQDVERFLALFKANERSFGSYRPNAKGQKAATVKATYTLEHARSHLEGEVGLGLVAILDDDMCHWAAIDIDVHGPNGRDVDLMKIEASVTSLKLPLVVCRSKSGGAHCYLFLKQPERAEKVRLMMARWAGQLGYAGAEIFPKQISVKLEPGMDAQPLGNWINLPYFDAHSTERYALDGGKQVSFEYFLELCETKKAVLAEIEVGGDAEYGNGPPCLQEMLKSKVEENRNIAAFQAGTFLKRAYPDDWMIRLKEFNQNAMIKPLGKGELGTITGSIRRKDYQYKCREDPCRAFCNKDLCRTREFGISGGDEKANDIPLVDKVEKIIATPVRWALTVQGQVIEMTTQELFNYDTVRQKVGEKLHLVLPRIKGTEWDVYLREIMAKVSVRHEATLEDMVFSKLCEYLRRTARDKETRTEDERRDDLRRGQPAMIKISKIKFVGNQMVEDGVAGWCYAFKLPDFIEYLRRRKQLPLPDHQMWSLLYKILGPEAKRERMRAGDHRISNVWVLPEDAVMEEVVPEKKYSTEY